MKSEVLHKNFIKNFEKIIFRKIIMIEEVDGKVALKEFDSPIKLKLVKLIKLVKMYSLQLYAMWLNMEANCWFFCFPWLRYRVEKIQ